VGGRDIRIFLRVNIVTLTWGDGRKPQKLSARDRKHYPKIADFVSPAGKPVMRRYNMCLKATSIRGFTQRT
jgi:hypothetical protein